jgi:hypothetical protein
MSIKDARPRSDFVNWSAHRYPDAIRLPRRDWSCEVGLVGSDLRGWHRPWTDYGPPGNYQSCHARREIVGRVFRRNVLESPLRHKNSDGCRKSVRGRGRPRLTPREQTLRQCQKAIVADHYFARSWKVSLSFQVGGAASGLSRYIVPLSVLPSSTSLT